MSITGKDLIERGWSEGRVLGLALKAANAGEAGTPEGPDKERELEALEQVRREPDRWAGTERYGDLARELMRLQAPEPYRFKENASFPVWGEHLIERGAFEQMERAIRLPISVSGALMPDAHLAYGLPVGGVLATEGAIIPYAIGVDIAPLRGDTMVPTLEGLDVAVRDLADMGHVFHVWATNEAGRIVAAEATAHQTQKDAPLVRVNLDNGEYVECTPDHEFMLRDGMYASADSLKPGTSLMPFYREVDDEGYLRITQNDSGKPKRAHWIVARSGLLGEIPALDGQRVVIHHDNFKQADNRPSNLVFMGNSDHSAFHRGLVERNTHWQSEEFERRRKEALAVKASTPEGYEQFAARAQRMNEATKADPSKQARYERTKRHRLIASEIGSRMFDCEVCGKTVKSRVGLAGHMRSHLPDGAYNHKVISVEKLEVREDVYCLDVPVHHNFALSAGVFVHNCRMRLTVVEMDPDSLDDASTRDALKDVVVRNTNFGAGGSYKPGRRGMDHPVMESPLWDEVPFVKQKRLRDLGEAQLGTSGSGNHFVEIGELEDLETRERKVAILSHSGSRGVGYKIADHFTKRAKERHPELPDEYKELAWLEMDHDLGREYHAAMTLAGEFARANHEVIHAKILRALGLDEPLSVIDHHHNWAWTEETPDGRTVYVHRKGATPAKAGQMGVIPGTMGDPGYVVRGLGKPESLESAAHGAGRVMSRNRAFKELSREEMSRYLSERGVTLVGGGLDESPQAYKRIEEVIGLQRDLVDVVARFTPKVVRMDAAGGARRRKKKARVEGAE